MSPRKDGIDFMARLNTARDILAAPPGIWTRSLTDELLAPKTACICGHLDDIAISINCYNRDDAAVGEEDMIERAVRIQQNLLALATNEFEVRHELLEIARRDGEQKPVPS
jgi:hypothetical protein